MDKVDRVNAKPVSNNVYLYVSHFYPYKNHTSLIMAFSLVKERGVKFKLWLVGASDFQIKNKLQHLVNSLGLSTDVIFLGELPQNEVRTKLLEAQYFIFPSSCENCPVALLEAMQAQLPILCSNQGVMPEIVGNAASYFDPNNPREIADKIIELHFSKAKQEELVKSGEIELSKFGSSLSVSRQIFEYAFNTPLLKQK